ncbi:MAG: hypothetical protein NT154_17360, partial [Verrucomicrobia bacterium]|nr:hypothetical protein [Verrucomicrobiota bacterium]
MLIPTFYNHLMPGKLLRLLRASLYAAVCLLALGADAQLPSNSLPLRIGGDQAGGNVFRGEIAALRIYDHALSGTEIARLASAKPDAKSSAPRLVSEYLFSGAEGRLFAKEASPPAFVTGAVKPANAGGVACARFEGGYLTISDQQKLAFPNGATFEVWIRPAPGLSGRILDKITCGGSDGFLLDTYPGDSLRLIVGAETLTVPFADIPYSSSPASAWLHVAATVDSGGVAALFANGRRVAGTVAEEGVALSGEAPAPGK